MRSSYYAVATGVSEAATGTITTSTASILTFTQARTQVMINNRSAQTLYVKFNDSAASPVVSATVYDAVLDNGEDLFIDGWLRVERVGVFVAASSGVQVVGW